MSRIIPRLCRQVQAIHCPRRMMSYRRNLPVFWWGRRRPFDDLFPSNALFDSHMKDFVDQFQKMERLMDPFARARNMGEILSGEAEVKYDDRLFQVKIDVRQYEPEELNVKLTDDRLVITGKHEQKADEHGYVSREFSREFVLPQNIDMDTFSSTLSEDGTMIIQARAKGAEIGKERTIKIEKQGKEQDKAELEEGKK